MPKVFISHSSHDRDFVETELIPILAHGGVEYWYSSQHIQTASDWENSIRSGLEGCDWFLVVLTPRSVASKWVRAEVHWAMNYRENRFIPALAENCDWQNLHLMIGMIQHIDFRQRLEHAGQSLLLTWGSQMPCADVAPNPSIGLEQNHSAFASPKRSGGSSRYSSDGMPYFRIFLSAPDEVAKERLVAKRVIHGMAEDYDEAIAIQLVEGKGDGISGGSSMADVPGPFDVDLYVCILWALPDVRIPRDATTSFGENYGSATGCEFEEAVNSYACLGTPEPFIYHKLHYLPKPSTPTQTHYSLMQWSVNGDPTNYAQKRRDAAVRCWFQRTDHKIDHLLRPYSSMEQFADLLGKDLVQAIERALRG